jgi:hypothetical protein
MDSPELSLSEEQRLVDDFWHQKFIAQAVSF